MSHPDFMNRYQNSNRLTWRQLFMPQSDNPLCGVQARMEEHCAKQLELLGIHAGPVYAGEPMLPDCKLSIFSSTTFETTREEMPNETVECTLMREFGVDFFRKMQETYRDSGYAIERADPSGWLQIEKRMHRILFEGRLQCMVSFITNQDEFYNTKKEQTNDGRETGHGAHGTILDTGSIPTTQWGFVRDGSVRSWALGKCAGDECPGCGDAACQRHSCPSLPCPGCEYCSDNPF